jgi:hypothetical protein
MVIAQTASANSCPGPPCPKNTAYPNPSCGTVSPTRAQPGACSIKSAIRSTVITLTINRTSSYGATTRRCAVRCERLLLSAAEDHCRDTMRALSRGILQRLNDSTNNITAVMRRCSPQPFL